jgi:N-alpha-acetyltransferase 15/16, NatA auxiliary subunit
VLRDLALLQIHIRDLDGFVETRRKLLQSKPTQKANWMAFAVGEHMRGNVCAASSRGLIVEAVLY